MALSSARKTFLFFPGHLECSQPTSSVVLFVRLREALVAKTRHTDIFLFWGLTVFLRLMNLDMGILLLPWDSAFR